MLVIMHLSCRGVKSELTDVHDDAVDRLITFQEKDENIKQVNDD